MREDEQLQRLRAAYHESGHATMAYFLGRPITLVSIRPTEHYSGVTRHGVITIPEADRAKLGLPVILLPTRFRRSIETSICIFLAGDVAEELAEPVVTAGYVPEPEREHESDAERTLRAVEELTARERERLDELEGRTEPMGSDEKNAWHDAWAVDGEAPGRYLEWLRAVTRSIASQPRFVGAVEALAAELLRREVVGGRRARQIIKQAVDQPLQIGVAAEERRSHAPVRGD